MNRRQEARFQNRIKRLKDEKQRLRANLAELKKAGQALQKELKESRRLLEEIPSGVALVQQGRVIYLNDVAQKHLGFTETEVMGRNVLDFVHPEAVEQVKRFHKRRIQGKSAPSQYETYLLSKAGEKLYCEVRVKKMRYRGRRAFLLNITSLDRRKSEEDLRVRLQKQEALGMMASGLKLQLDGCLSPLKERAALLKGWGGHATKDDQDSSEALSKIVAAAEELAVVSRNLGILTKPRYLPSELVPFSLKKLVQEAVTLTRPQWEEASKSRAAPIQFKTYLRTLSPVQCHPGEMVEALSHLILNAVQALPKGGEIYLTTEESAGFAHVYIQDNGTAIPGDLQNKIFDPFFSTKGEESPGLGLSLAFAIFRRHGGEIEVMSGAGQGTTFAVKLPLLQEPILPRVRHRPGSMKDANFLIIVQEEIPRDLLAKVFTVKGARVTTTASFAQGLKVLKKSKVTMLIADLETPDLSSLKEVAKIKKEDGMPLIALIQPQGKGKRGLREKVPGVDLWIERPLDMDRILRLASEAILGLGDMR
jgi:PAS domain S-box-containing protein